MRCSNCKVLCGFVGGLACAGAALSLGFRADDKHAGHAPAAAPAMDEAAQMELWMKSAAPGENHKWLAQMAGEWDTTMKLSMAPGAPMEESKGTASRTLSLDGRFLEESYAASMMGMPFKGKGVTGFDNNRKVFSGVWYDSMGTGMMVSKGALSKDRKTLTMFGEMDEPMTGEMGKIVRYSTTIVDADHHTFKMDEVMYGEPFTVFEISYARKKQ